MESHPYLWIKMEVKLLTYFFLLCPLFPFKSHQPKFQTAPRRRQLIESFLLIVFNFISVPWEREMNNPYVLSRHVSLPYLPGTVVNVHLFHLIWSTMEVIWRWECMLEWRDLQKQDLSILISAMEVQALSDKEVENSGDYLFLWLLHLLLK